VVTIGIRGVSPDHTDQIDQTDQIDSPCEIDDSHNEVYFTGAEQTRQTKEFLGGAEQGLDR